LLARKEDVVLERSFYAKEDRDEFRGIAEQGGARVVLVFLRAKGEQGKEVLWERICRRSEGVKTADSALFIDRETFEGYWKGFEDPNGEGEIVVEVV
jgi:predicted kinase